MKGYAHPKKQSRFILLLALSLLMTMAGPGQPAAAQQAPHQPAGTAAVRDFFGHAVALSGDLALVGAPEDDDAEINSGSVSVYERQADGTWTRTTLLTSSDAANGDQFGYSLSLSGPYALVGAPSKLDGNLSPLGGAYIFEQQADGSWNEVAALIPDDNLQSYGSSVAISGGLALVEASGDDTGGVSGSVYVYERQADGSWSQTTKLNAADTEDFGFPVALSGERALIGAELADETDGVLVYERQADGAWSQTATLTPDDTTQISSFGRALALQGDRALIGVIEGAFANEVDVAYVYERQADGAWTRTARLTPSDEDIDFGQYVALSGERAVVTDPSNFGIARYAGAAYVFERQADGAWSETAKLTANDTAEGDLFGSAVALSGDDVLVGAPNHSGRGLEDEGAAYVFSRQPDGSWTETAKLAPAESLAVLSYTLIDADTDQPVAGYDPIPEGATLDLAQLPPRLNMRANTTADIRSVVVRVSFITQPPTWLEHTPPFSVFRDQAGDYAPFQLPVGNHTITATPYTKNDRGILAGQGFPLTLNFTAVHGDIGPLSVTRLVLVDAATDEDLFELEHDMTLNLDELPPHLNVRADVTGPVATVRFNMSNYQRTESVPPYALFGDTNGNYLTGTFESSLFWLRVTPFGRSGNRVPGVGLEYLLDVEGTSAAKVAVPTGTFEEGTDEPAGLPAAYALEANYPNPFNPSTVISFSLPEASPVRVAVYDLLGRQVALLADGPMPAGHHEVSFDGSGLSSGLYLYRLETPGQAFVRRMHLLK